MQRGEALFDKLFVAFFESIRDFQKPAAEEGMDDRHNEDQRSNQVEGILPDPVAEAFH